MDDSIAFALCHPEEPDYDANSSYFCLHGNTSSVLVCLALPTTMQIIVPEGEPEAFVSNGRLVRENQNWR